MIDAHTTILLGNGPNRLREAAASWNDVLQQLIAMAPRPGGAPDLAKPLTLLFDEIALTLERQRRGGPRELRNRIADLMRPLSPNSVHGRIMALGLQDILTTNYDYTLESAIPDVAEPPSSPKPCAAESKFSLFRHRRTGTSRVWHIHGEIDYPRTLQLGYEHYGAYLGQMHSYVTDGVRGYVSPFIRGKAQFEATARHSWIDVFLRDNVHIIGLTLDFSEIDLWWLLIYKERLRWKSRHSVGVTVYHHIHVGELTLIDRMRLATLEGVGVKTAPVEIDGDWGFAKAYHAILSGLRMWRAAPNSPLHATRGKNARA